eukprot:gnl/TRDRNA2_/TRDRNA2_43591_c0_seq1.p1 gnl/TRDRNA2_/TRDRNA2_43591_c0~~gnl/TRDRNA2_/TRDRNA2_43591_c0_seq1.p1  ORF type:complete len:311 (+),score=47.20 gnl/TRDRNA2_/TRDRNA2_43591_c0_seq1:47-979(+)
MCSLRKQMYSTATIVLLVCTIRALSNELAPRRERTREPSVAADEQAVDRLYGRVLKTSPAAGVDLEKTTLLKQTGHLATTPAGRLSPATLRATTANALPPRRAPEKPLDVRGGVPARRDLVGLGVATVFGAGLSPARAETERQRQDRLAREYNERITKRNKAPPGFPIFVRKGYEVEVITPEEGFQTQKDGLMYKDFQVGEGKSPRDGEEVTFDYEVYNENGRRVDSSYGKDVGKARLGLGTMIPGVESALKGMKPGGKRRAIVPPDLGPPTGPSTFFSAKQYEVFDLELKTIKQCKEKQILLVRRTVCE